jgi:hypothetical protein
VAVIIEDDNKATENLAIQNPDEFVAFYLLNGYERKIKTKKLQIKAVSI